MAKQKFFLTKDELEALYAECKTAIAVAKKIGVDKATVLHRLKQYGIERTGKRELSEDDKRTLVKMALEGHSAKEAAEAISFSIVTVNKFARKNGFSFKDEYHKGFITTDSGYRKIYAPEHSRADGKGYVGEHVLLIEESLGRRLHTDEVVHHVDGNKQNNVLANLQVMTDAEHRSLHAARRDSGWGKYHDSKI